jgi:hypothetical protein
MIDKLFKTKSGIIIVSILWGLGLSCMFRQACKGRGCIVMRAPNPNDMINDVYSFNNSCYKYSIQNTKCSGNDIPDF